MITGDNHSTACNVAMHTNIMPDTN